MMPGDVRARDNKSSLAHRAQQKYIAGKYMEAIDALQKLIEEIAPETDFKVQQNLIIANFVAGTLNPKDLEQNLRTLLNSLVLDGTEKMENKNNMNESGSLLSNTSTIDTKYHAALIRYNLAASLFLQKQLSAASSILDTLIRNLDSIDEKVAMHVCFLYLDIILHSCRGCVSSDRERMIPLKKANLVLQYLEKPHSFNGLVESKMDGEHHTILCTSGNGVTSSTDGNGVDITSGERKIAPEIIEFRFRMHLYKAKLYLLQCNLKFAKKEMKSALEMFQKEMKSAADSVNENMINSLFSPPMITIAHPSLAVQNTTALFLKANLEYLRKNSKKCIRLMASCSQDAVDASLFLNNMGCIHFQMGHRKAAQSYFARALVATTKSNGQYVSTKTNEPVQLTSSPQYEIMYNNGVQLLLKGEYKLAFRCFYSSSHLFYNRPRLWLRMGECCTRAFTEHQKAVTAVGNRSNLIHSVVGSGSSRRVLLSPSIPTSMLAQSMTDGSLPTSSSDTTSQNGRATKQMNSSNAADVPQMTLAFAAKCFLNVILLCSQLMENSTSTQSEDSMPSNEATPSVNGPTPDMEILDLLRQKALVNLSFAYLSMFEPQLAIARAKDLLALPTCTKANAFLARTYAAEALCMVSRASEATYMLQSEKDLMSMAEEYASEAKIQPSKARAGVHVNNASTLILQHRTSEAEDSVTRAVRENPGCRESLQLLVYVLLKKQDTKKALRVLKEAQVIET